MQIDRQLIPKAIQIHMKQVDGQILVHDDINRNIHVFNETAAAIIRLCDGEHSVDAIADALSGDPEVGIDRIRQDVIATLEQFHALGLLEKL